MKKLKLYLFLTALAAAGCVPSIHPLYNDQNVIFDDKLAGQWVCSDPNWQWNFEKKGAANKNYDVKIIDDKGKAGAFDVHLVKIDDANYLDFYPAGEPNWPESDFYKMHLISAHTFMKITPDPNGYTLSWMGGEKFNKKIKEDPNLIKHEKYQGDGIVLTASTEELIDFVKKYSKQDWLFVEEFGIYPRKK